MVAFDGLVRVTTMLREQASPAENDETYPITFPELVYAHWHRRRSARARQAALTVRPVLVGGRRLTMAQLALMSVAVVAVTVAVSAGLAEWRLNDIIDSPLYGSEPNPLATGGRYIVVKQNVRVWLSRDSFLDLDQPLADTDGNHDQAEMAYGSENQRPYFYFISPAVALADSKRVTPDECMDDIHVAPSETRVRVSHGLVLCIATNGASEKKIGQPKIARVIVDSIAKDGHLNLSITTWEFSNRR